MILDRVRFVEAQNGKDITFADLAEIDFGAVSIKEILQNVRTILLTPKYSVPLNRLFGMDFLYVDMPQNQARDILVSEILEAIHFWEKRVEVVDVTFDPESDLIRGQVIPIVHLRIRNQTYAGLPYDDYLEGKAYG
jgi:phage baseplate assembly protein W